MKKKSLINIGSGDIRAMAGNKAFNKFLMDRDIPLDSLSKTAMYNMYMQFMKKQGQ